MALRNNINYWFDCDDQDIVANRQGYMSRRQLDDMRKAKILRRTLFCFVGAIIFFPTILPFIFLADEYMYDRKWFMWLAIVSMLVMICIILFRNLYGHNPKAKKQYRPILTIQGQVRLYSQPRFSGGRGQIYRVRIEDRLTFHVKYQQWNSLEDGEHYILYYSPQSFRIMSLEKMSTTVI